MGNAGTIAIHQRAESFSDRWIARCSELKVPYRIVDCHAADVLSRIASSRALLWHWHHSSPTDLLIARNVIAAAELAGLHVFPSTATCWHFDDKVAQKYLLDAIEAPTPTTWVFFDLEQALQFVETCSLPVVFKLRRGAGSANVQLARTRRQARSWVSQAFREGFVPAKSVTTDFKLKLQRAKRRHDLLAVIARLPRTLANIRRARTASVPEKGYVYFQEFLEGNGYDTRVTVIGERAFAFTRNVRRGDFRASGSGDVHYDEARIDPRCVRMAFDVAQRTRSQSMAFDFLRDQNGNPRIVEVSYAYVSAAVHACPGHWDPQLGWHAGQVWPEDAILDDVLTRLASQAGTATVGRP